MRHIDINRTIQTFANVGVLVGIGFLAVEIGQNNRVIEEQNAINTVSARFAALDGFNGMRTLMLENPELLRVTEAADAGEELTSFEARQLQLLCLNQLWLRVSLHVQSQAFGAPDLSHIETVKRQNEDSEYRRDCWESAKGALIASGFGDFVDAVDNGSDE